MDNFAYVQLTEVDLFLHLEHTYLYTAMEVMVLFSSQTIFRDGRVVDGGQFTCVYVFSRSLGLLVGDQ